MKKIALIVLAAILALTVAGFASCGIIEKVENAVTYPDTYSITYEITTADGLIHTLTKSVDENGNLYFKSIDSEKLFINNAGTYTLYEKNESGAFAAKDGAKYTRKAAEAEMSAFDEYSHRSTDQFIPTASKSGTDTVAGRTADVYKIGVNLLAVSFYHVYSVDTETGICLGISVDNTVFGGNAETNEETFICTEFITEGVSDLSLKLAE